MYLTASALTEEILDCNQTLCQRLGYDKPELIGRPFRTVYPDNERSEAAGRLELLGRADGFQDVERTLRCKDGALLEVSLNLRPVRDSRGETIGVKATWRDISRRKQADRDRQLLLQLGETLRSQTDRTGVLSAVAIQLGRYLGATRCVFAGIDQARDLAISQGGYAIDGSWPAGATQLSSLDAAGLRECAEGRPFAVGDRATDPRTVESHAAGAVGADRSLLWVPRMREGRWVASLLISCAGPRPWEEREVALAQLVAERVWQWIDHLDVLADLRRRDVAEAVQRTEARFRALVDSVRDYAIVMLDPAGKVLTWSAGAELVSGHPAEEILGKDFTAFHTPEQLADEEPGRALEAARATGRFEEEGWRFRRDGARFWANVVLTAIHDPGGALVGFATITRDFTERRKQEQVLTQSLKEREVLLQEVHHRVKNNLQVISSLLNLQVASDPSGARGLRESQSRVQSMALVHQLLYRSKDFSHIDLGEYLHGLAKRLVETYQVGRDRISISVEAPPIRIDIDRAIPCALILNELVTNSLQHAFPNDRHGTIRVTIVEEDGQIILTVRDDGVGLPAHVRTDRSFGLRIARTLTAQLAGTLDLDSNGGTTARLAIPTRS
jgi:PAS domain S-box-containing protein